MAGKRVVVALSLFGASCSPAAAIRRDDPNHYIGNGQQGAMDSLINSFGGGNSQPSPVATTAAPQAKPMTEAEIANVLRDRLRGFSLPKAPAQAGIKPGAGSKIDEVRNSIRGIFGGADSTTQPVPESKTDKIIRQVGDYLDSHKEEEQKPKTAAGQAVAEVTNILEEEFNKFVDPLVGEAPANGLETIQQLKKLRGLLTKEKSEKALPSTEDDILNLKTDMDKVKAETARMVASLVNVTQHNSIVEMMRRQKRERQELRKKAIERRLLGSNPRTMSDSAQPASLLESEATAGEKEEEERDPAFASMRQKLLARIAAAKKEAEAELANATGLPASQAAAALVSSDPSDEQEEGADAGEAAKSGALARDGHILYKMMKAVGKGSNELGSEILKDVVHTLDNITEANAVHEKGGFLANPKEHIQAFSNKIKAWSEYFSKNIRSTAHTASQGFGSGSSSGFTVTGMDKFMDQIKVQTKAPSAEEQ